jgi:hypothetical protein
MRKRNVALVWSLVGLLLLSPAAALGAAPQGGDDDSGVGRLPPEASEFDFWIGTWQVNGGGVDKVKRFGKGVAILETWKGLGGGGWSVNVFDVATRTWTQTWQTNTGQYLQVTGKKQGDAIVLVGKTRNPQTGAVDLLRLSFVNITRNRFEQRYEVSADDGATWQRGATQVFTRVQ